MEKFECPVGEMGNTTSGKGRVDLGKSVACGEF